MRDADQEKRLQNNFLVSLAQLLLQIAVKGVKSHPL